ncbi:hypothetical protein FRB96_004131 [Tulasnella sp. 330]|nr:hypothetical protein FRB96_004131 [Tulasnella sp. 330]
MSCQVQILDEGIFILYSKATLSSLYMSEYEDKQKLTSDEGSMASGGLADTYSRGGGPGNELKSEEELFHGNGGSTGAQMDKGQQEERLVILDDEPSGGRPVGPQYWDRGEKLTFMDKHGIDISVVSSANPWLDPLPVDEAISLASELNTELESYCSSSPSVPSSSFRRLYGLGLLPLVRHVPVPTILESITQISELSHLRGVILGTRGLGKGLDDDALNPVWEAIEKAGLVVFLHPHYGVGEGKEWGEKENGHVLPLALGFPMETTCSITRLILSGVYDRHPNLKIILAHSGGTLSQLSSRISSCIAHDPVVSGRLKHDFRYYLGKLWFDAVAYGPEELEFVSATIGRSHQYAVYDKATKKTSIEVAMKDKKVGSRRLLWGTDHPFFPPISDDASEGKWQSVVENLKAIEDVAVWGEDEKDGVRGRTAIELFNL